MVPTGFIPYWTPHRCNGFVKSYGEFDGGAAVLKVVAGLKEIGATLDLTRGQLAIAWVLRRPEVICEYEKSSAT